MENNTYKCNNDIYICGKCGLGGLNFNLYNYCPFCGSLKTDVDIGIENNNIKNWKNFVILNKEEFLRGRDE